MAPILNTQTSTGLPLCLSGITHPTALSNEIADHDRRRKGFKKSRLRLGKSLHAAPDQDNYFGASTQRIQYHPDLQVEGVHQGFRGEVLAEDLAAVALLLHHLSSISLYSCTAKAA